NPASGDHASDEKLGLPPRQCLADLQTRRQRGRIRLLFLRSRQSNYPNRRETHANPLRYCRGSEEGRGRRVVDSPTNDPLPFRFKPPLGGPRWHTLMFRSSARALVRLRGPTTGGCSRSSFFWVCPPLFSTQPG